MKNNLTITLMLLLFVVGCATTPTRVQSGKITAQTFSFVQPGPSANLRGVEQRKPIHAAIQSAIRENLEAKGLTYQPRGGDITVAYLMIVGNNVSTKSVADYFGYGREYADLQDKAHQKIAVDGRNPNYFEVGTLLIDLIDSGDQSLQYRNYAYRELFKDLPEETRKENLQSAVEEILAKLRLAK
ncbi:MAG: DUF4136 domain-containing protein [Kiritimatiellae bacterium]|nr:DUF4136 domain-containing protein [Kiritimatiellia bacterium]